MGTDGCSQVTRRIERPGTLGRDNCESAILMDQRHLCSRSMLQKA